MPCSFQVSYELRFLSHELHISSYFGFLEHFLDLFPSSSINGLHLCTNKIFKSCTYHYGMNVLLLCMCKLRVRLLVILLVYNFGTKQLEHYHQASVVGIVACVVRYKNRESSLHATLSITLTPVILWRADYGSRGL